MKVGRQLFFGSRTLVWLSVHLYEYVKRYKIGRLVLKKTLFFCVGEYPEYGFDHQRLKWYVCRLWDIVFS